MPRWGEKDTENERGVRDQSGNAASDVGEKNDDKRKPRKYNNSYSNRNRNNRYYGKNRYHSGGNDRRYYKKARYDVGERLKEVDLGITEYVGDTEGFTGTIKERFTDFVVHEISTNGEIAKLSNQEIPPDPEDFYSIEDLKKKIPEDVWNQLQSVKADWDISIDVTNMDRNQRKYIHQIVKKLTSVVSATRDIGNKKIIVFSKEYKSNSDTKTRDNRKDWSMRGGDYCHFILHKVNMDTMDALNQICKVMRLKANIFSYAGTKDRRAKTTQWISVKKMNPKNIMHAAKAVMGAYVGNFKFEKEPLRLGKLDGNRFTIALRNVSASDELIEKAMVSLRDNGFINYYGLQRFGTIAAIPTYEIGKALLQGNWLEAIDLILKPREGEQDTNLAEAREIYKNTKNSRLAYQKIGRNDKIEAKLLWGLNTCGEKNPQGALDMIPRNTMLMYIHAYQSIVWNKIVSKRIKEFGLKPIVGDLVYENPDSKDDLETTHDDTNQHTVVEDKITNSDQTINSNAEDQKTDENNVTNEDSQKSNEHPAENSLNSEDKKEASKAEEDKTSDKSDKERPIPKVKILTEEDLPNYTILDIVMPQPGYKVTYPPYAKSWFDEYLEKDGLNTELKQKNKKYTLNGSYRKIIQAAHNLSWKILRYLNKTDDLIMSDIDEMKGIAPPKDNPEGTFKALVIQMSLRPSAYATMALREVLKCDTSSQTHAAQSAAFRAAHEKIEEEKKNEQSKSIDGSETDDNILRVENLQLRDHSSEEAIQSTEDEGNEKKEEILVASSSLLEESVIEDESKTLKSNENISNSTLESHNVDEEKIELDDSNSTCISKNENPKHEADVINDSGIEPGSVVNA